MKKLAIVMLSGGLDSTLAARIVQLQGFEVVGLNIRTPFHCSVNQAIRAACELQIPLVLREVGDDYLDVLRYPKHGYGRGANPCIDCRVFFLRMAKELLEQLDAMLVATGEVVGQRPMSQKRRDLGIIAHTAGLQDRVLRPLSAKCLPPTIPEQEGWVNREQLYDFTGRSRKGLRALGRELGLKHIPDAAGGCMLTEVQFAPKVFDLLDHDPVATLWDCRLLSIGRHFRLDDEAKVIIGRSETDNLALRRLFRRRGKGFCALIVPANFVGPEAILIGAATPARLENAAGLMVRYVHRPMPDQLEFQVDDGTARQTLSLAKEKLLENLPNPE